MHSYSVGVALFDFVPVLVTALGLLLLARAIAALYRPLAPVAWAAALLIPFGGLCKASWKLIVALSQREITWLENLLFVAMAPGFVMMAFCLFHARRAWQQGFAVQTAGQWMPRLLLWMTPPVLGGLLAFLLWPDTRRWFFWLLGVTTFANATLLVQAVIAARRSGLGAPVVACFLFNFAATLALSGLSRLPPGEFTAWIQEGVNLFAQAALALGLWRLAGRMLNDRRNIKP